MAANNSNSIFVNFAVALSLTAAAAYVSYNILKFFGASDKTKSKSNKDDIFPVFKKTTKSEPENIVKDGISDHTMKGYKITSDGKKTSYFTRELSDQDKAILAASNTGPQRIYSTDDTIMSSVTNAPIKLPASDGNSNKVGSDWNAAGTFEEKDVSVWARKHLQTLLTGLKVINAGGTQLQVFVESVQEVSGDASIVFTRGKHKFIYDLSVEISFILTPDQKPPLLSHSATSTKGKIRVNDITADNEQEVIISEVTGRDTNRQNGSVFRRSIGLSLEDESNTLLKSINAAIRQFQHDYKNSAQGN